MAATCGRCGGRGELRVIRAVEARLQRRAALKSVHLVELAAHELRAPVAHLDDAVHVDRIGERTEHRAKLFRKAARDAVCELGERALALRRRRAVEPHRLWRRHALRRRRVVRGRARRPPVIADRRAA